MIKIKVPAKINLFLEITKRRPDGYHNLDTLFAKIGIYDELIIKKLNEPGIKLTVKGAVPGYITDNIVYKAASLFFKHFDVEPAVDITLVKNIPIGAGLGGGSSDGAATLTGLCKYYKISVEENFKLLKRLALQLGSDVPLFIYKDKFLHGRGRGELLKPVKAAKKMPNVLLVYPNILVSTKLVYGNLKMPDDKEIKQNIKKLKQLLSAIEKGNFNKDCANLLFNRLEEPAFKVSKEIKRIKDDLSANGCDMVLMSGSGSSVFGLVWDNLKAKKILAKLSKNKKFKFFLIKFAKI